MCNYMAVGVVSYVNKDEKCETGDEWPTQLDLWNMVVSNRVLTLIH